MNPKSTKVFVADNVRAVQQLHADLFTNEFRQLPIRDQLEAQAQRLLHAHQSGNTTAAIHITCWHPLLVCHSVDQILDFDFQFGDALETISREYGFADWTDAQKNGDQPTDEDFEDAVDALLVGNAELVQEMLIRKPTLIRDRSCFGHRSTLLHYAGSNGVETHRQQVPLNLATMIRIILDAGADVNATADMYGGGSTTLALLISSSHPADAEVMEDTVKVLVDAGARTE